MTLQVMSDDVIAFCPPFLTVSVNESARAGHVVTDLNSTKGDNDVTYSFVSPVDENFNVNGSTVSFTSSDWI